jgi:hypothetical protein
VKTGFSGAKNLMASFKDTKYMEDKWRETGQFENLLSKDY